MQQLPRSYLQIANQLQENLIVRHQREAERSDRQLGHVGNAADRLRVIERKLQKANRNGFTGAAKRLRARLDRVLGELYSEVNMAREVLTRRRKGEVPKLSEILKDLQQIEHEFGGCDMNPRNRVVAVRTEPIELQGLYLGPFELVIEIGELTEPERPMPCRVVALDPQPAASNDAVTHPHVSDEQLCAGDATRAIESAIANGRLCEALMLIRSVLRQYNPASPYVAIDEWSGEPCEECGYRMSEDIRCLCEACDRVVCDECIAICQGCDTPICPRCIDRCEGCDEPFCDRCLRVCDGCGDQFCEACIEDSLCETCNEKEPDHGQETNEEESGQSGPQEDGQPQTEEQPTSEAGDPRRAQVV